MSAHSTFHASPGINGVPDIVSTPTAISIRDLRVVRGGATILDDITLDIPRGVVFGLVGPSGSGKTTFIRSLIGRQRIAGGEILIDGLPAGSMILRDRIGYLPQESAIYSDLTGRENLEFFASVYRVAHSRVDDLLDLLDLSAAADRPVVTYSGGQQRRIGLGVALLAEPPFLILDEPTVGLDPRLRHRLWTSFANWAAGGSTLLISTHVMDEAARVDRMALFVDGAVIALGAPTELLARTGATDLEGAMLTLSADGRAA